MGIENIDKKSFMKDFFDNMDLIADKEQQKRAWIMGIGPVYYDFDEAVIIFFEHVEIILKNYRDFNIDESQHLLLKSFSNEFKTFSDEHDWPQDFIDTPKWTKITEMAKEVLDAFHWERHSSK